MQLTINGFKFINIFNNLLYWWNQCYKFVAYAVRNTHNLPTIIPEKKTSYTKPNDLHYESGIEYGRNFALWKCLNCGKSWSSAYSWISTKFCLQNTKTMIVKGKNSSAQKKESWFSGAELKDQDFIIEKCKDCDTSAIPHNVKIVRYNKLKWKGESEDNSPHRRDLCAKCLKGDFCNKSIL